jgi:hypothetical protein
MVNKTQLTLIANIGLIPRYGIGCNKFSSTQEINWNSAKGTTSPNLVKIGMTAVKQMEKRKCKMKVCLWWFQTNDPKRDICVPSLFCWQVKPTLTKKNSRWYPHN